MLHKEYLFLNKYILFLYIVEQVKTIVASYKPNCNAIRSTVNDDVRAKCLAALNNFHYLLVDVGDTLCNSPNASLFASYHGQNNLKYHSGAAQRRKKVLCALFVMI